MALKKTDCVPINYCDFFIKDKIFEESRNQLTERGIDINNELKRVPVRRDTENMASPPLDNILVTPEKFEILIDARGFDPEQLKCSINGSMVEIVAVKEEIAGNSQRKTSLTRNYALPQPAKAEDANCYLSKDGMLLITAPWTT